MKNFKRLIVVTAIVAAITVTGTVFADGFKTPVDILSSLTGKTTTELSVERSTGKTYGTIANDAGKLDEFQSQMLEQKKAILDQRVKDGSLTQAQADEIYLAIKTNQATCNGTGSAGIGRKYGVGFGSGFGMGRGGRGMGLQRGGCTLNSPNLQ